MGSQKEMISNFGRNERILLQVKMETEQEELGRNQKLLQQEKNQFFHVGLFGKKRETNVDGWPSPAWHNELEACL